MARTARDERLDTRSARVRLTPRREPYWRVLQEGRAIGYRRLAGGKAGSWVARRHDADTGRGYRALGSADDLADADGKGTLSFAQAQEAARAWFAAPAAEAAEAGKPITVAEALDAYVADYAARGGKALPSLKATIEAHIRPNFGTRTVASLTAAEIKRWHQGLATTAPRLRTKKDATKPGVRTVDGDDGQRARRSTANRIFTVFRAALNLAFRDGRVANDSAWRRVKPFQRVDAARVRFLDDLEARRLANACPSDLRRLVTAALLTGMRLGELAAMRVADLDAQAGTIHVPYAKGGHPRHVVLTAEGIAFFKDLAAGRARDSLALLRDDGEGWGKSQQHRPLHEACGKAKILPAVGFHILRHTHASRLARAGVPMLAIAAQLGHASVAITQKHYAHLSPDHVAQAVRAGFSDMGLVEPSNVVRIGG